MTSILPKAARSAPRGYALLFVLGIALILSILIGGLFDLLTQDIKNSAAGDEDLQQLYGCEGALRVASHIAMRSQGDEISQLQSRMTALTSKLKRDVSEGRQTPYADLDGITVLTTQAGESPADVFPFSGMLHVSESFEFVVSANPVAAIGRTCRSSAPNKRRTMSLFQFAAASHQSLNRSFTGKIGVTAGTTGEVATLQHSMITGGGMLAREQEPFLDELSDRQERVPRSSGTRSFTVRNIHVADFLGLRPVAPADWIWVQIVLWRQVAPWRGNSGIRNRPSYKPPSMEYYTKAPVLDWTNPRTNEVLPDPDFSRFALQADIRVIDGEWYLGGGQRYPGTRVWSDRPIARQSADPVHYSDYEEGDVGMTSGVAVVRYGAKTPMPGSNPLDYVRDGFLDPYVGGDKQPTPIMPIVFDVDRFGQAMTEQGPGQLGRFRCLEEDPIRCTEADRFKGAVWIGTSRGGQRPNGLTTGHLPCPLVDRNDTNCARPNAVVLTNVGNLDRFVHTGLSIGSNLPIYIIGGVNDLTPPEKQHSRVSIMAPVITVLSTDTNLSTVAWSTRQSSILNPNHPETVTVNASIFTGWASDDPAKRDPAEHLLRRLQPSVRLRVVGSMVGMFTRSRYVLHVPAEVGGVEGAEAVAVDGSTYHDSDYAGIGGSEGDVNGFDPEILGLPMFIPNNDNPEEEASRLAPTSILYPGHDSSDLRRAAFERQPPASPRLSLVPERPDWKIP